MDATLQSLAYRKKCELIGEMLSDYGRQKDGNAAPSFNYRPRALGAAAYGVIASLKRLEFRSLLDPALLDALIAITDGYNELKGFQLLFKGLRTLLEAGDEQGDW